MRRTPPCLPTHKLKIYKILRLQRRQLVPATDNCQEAVKNMLKLRSIGIRDYSVLEGHQRIGRIRFADERMPPIWLWNVSKDELAAAYRDLNIRDDG